MDDNARPHRSRAVTAYLQSEAVTSVPWPAMSPDFNPIEHIWDMLGRRILAREPPVHSSVGSSIASGMAAAITTEHPTSKWRDETQG
jgi:transposase